jgi:hypothetical protein
MKKLLAAFLLFAGCTSSNSENNGPHALGTITLGESHPSSGGNSSPIVSASFVPDASIHGCTADLAGCEVVAAPTCTPSCAIGEFCTFDESCSAVCKKPCSRACNTGEVCVFDAGNQPVCVVAETFDAGPLAFSGTTTAITLFPPYAYTATQQGAPFLSGGNLEVQAQGAIGAGFTAFDVKYTATSFLQTVTPLDQIPRTTVFGPGMVPIYWVAGNDQIVITASGSGGSATCIAEDSSGSFNLPREVVDATVGKGTALSLSVGRRRTEVRKGIPTQGQLSNAFVQPQGWLELVTLSMESTSYVGCGQGRAACGTGSACVDIMADKQNCGGCGVKCASAQICLRGQCADPVMACNDCFIASQTGDCKSSYNACTADTECSALRTCVDACADNTCVQNCFNAHPTAATLWDNFINCACHTACTAECVGTC